MAVQGNNFSRPLPCPDGVFLWRQRRGQGNLYRSPQLVRLLLCWLGVLLASSPRMQSQMWVSWLLGGWIWLILPSTTVIIDGELRSRSQKSQGAAPIDGRTSTSSSTATPSTTKVQWSFSSSCVRLFWRRRLAARRSSSSGSRRIQEHGCNFFFLGVLREVWLELLSLYPLCTCLYFICFHVRCPYFGEATSRRRLHTGSHYTTPQEEYPPNLLATTATQIRLFPPLVTAARVVMHDGRGKPAALARWISIAHMVFF